MSSSPPVLSPTLSPNVAYSSPTIILAVILLMFFCVGFFSVFFCRCFMESVASWQPGRTPSGNAQETDPSTNTGLDPSRIKVFPTFTYLSVKEFRREKRGLECAICLTEFSDDDMLRLITVCYHVYHQDCIDHWLETHKTCPVCRSDLELPKETLEKTPILGRTNSSRRHNVGDSTDNNNDNNNNNAVVHEHAISISIREDDVSNAGENDSGEQAGEVADQHEYRPRERCKKAERFSRTHSTGHSVIETRGEEDKYTLRLFEFVKLRRTREHGTAGSCTTFGAHSTGHSIIETRGEGDKYTSRLLGLVKVKMTRGFGPAGSCTTFGDFSSPGCGSFGEVSA